MGTYGYISIIAMVCYGFMLLMFLTAKRNKIVNSFLVVLVGLLFWAGGSAFMRVHLWPSYEFWYQVSLLGILLLPYAYYCFILAFGGVKKSLPGKIYLAVMLICFVVNIRHGVFLGCPNVVEKNGLPTFVYEIKPTILVLFFPAGIFLICTDPQTSVPVADAGIAQSVLRCGIFVFCYCIFECNSISAENLPYTDG